MFDKPNQHYFKSSFLKKSLDLLATLTGFNLTENRLTSSNYPWQRQSNINLS